jgi:hypothetical protein
MKSIVAIIFVLILTSCAGDFEEFKYSEQEMNVLKREAVEVLKNEGVLKELTLNNGSTLTVVVGFKTFKQDIQQSEIPEGLVRQGMTISNLFSHLTKKEFDYIENAIFEMLQKHKAVRIYDIPYTEFLKYSYRAYPTYRSLESACQDAFDKGTVTGFVKSDTIYCRNDLLNGTGFAAMSYSNNMYSVTEPISVFLVNRKLKVFKGTDFTAKWGGGNTNVIEIKF